MVDAPKLEGYVGLETYGSKTDGISGWLKQETKDFIVEELTQDGILCSVGEKSDGFQTVGGEYTHFTMVKDNWTVFRAIREISNRLRTSNRRFSYAGTKDKDAVTAQRVSAQGISPESFDKLLIKDIILKDFSLMPSQLDLGELRGNKFTITVRGIKSEVDAVNELIQKINAELSYGYPNYYGIQRFGFQRPITHLVGKEIILGNFEEAIMTYLTGHWDNEYESEESREFRKYLLDTQDFKKGLKMAPKYLGHEKSLLNHLVKSNGDYIGAIKQMPLNLSMMFVHAFQSYVYNRALSECLKHEFQVERLPVVGFKSKPDDISKKILEQEQVDVGNFLVRKIPRISSTGTIRDCFEFVEDLEYDVSEDELNPSMSKAVFSFLAKPGCYATVFLREFMKNNYWDKHVNQ